MSALPVTQTHPSMPVYLQGWHATSATTPLSGALPPSTYRIPAFAVKMPVLTTREQPAVTATPPTFPRRHASNATTATILSMEVVVVMIKLLNS
jgi:hypothetical protein